LTLAATPHFVTKFDITAVASDDAAISSYTGIS